MSPRLFKEWLIRHQITHSYQPTAMATALLAEEWPEDRPWPWKCYEPGETRLASYPSRRYPFRFFNLYGPTEDSVWTTWCEVKARPTPGEYGQSPYIGRPVPNHGVYILGPRNDLRPMGCAGELCITGIGLAAGYLNKPELTAERFNRTHKSYRTNISYKTGDLARWLPDGNIEYLGRIDQQVKIRGFRIELGEIESCLITLDNIKEAVVIDREDPQGEKYLCAYIVCRRDPDTAANYKSVSPCITALHDPGLFYPLPGIPFDPQRQSGQACLACA